MPISASPDDAGDGTLYADPGLRDGAELDDIATWERSFPGAVENGKEIPESALARLLKDKMVEADEAPKLDARDWPAATGFHEQIVENVDGLAVPKHRLRQLRFSDGRIVYEVWTPIPRKLEPHEIGLASRGGLPVGSWRLSYHVYSPEWCTCPRATLQPHPHGLIHPDCGRLKKSKVEGSFAEHVLSLQMQTEDEAIYNGYYPTIAGDDIAHVNPAARPGTMAHHQGGEALRKYNPEGPGDEFVRGGTEIRGGRAEHRRLTKNMVEMGPGVQKDIDRANAEKKAKHKQATRIKLEKKIQLGPRQIGEL